MLTAKIDSGSGNYDRRYIVTAFDDEVSRQALEIFEDYQRRGIILNNSYSDNIWIFSNQIKRIYIKFTLSEIEFRKTGKWLGCSFQSFMDGIKAYTVFQLGNLSLEGLREMVRTFTRLTGISGNELPEGTHVPELLRLLPGGSEARDYIIEAMEEKLLFGSGKRIQRRQRILAEFNAYFRFNDTLMEFWQAAPDSEKLFYFPVYFWWNLTSVLPLRPTEFLLTPKNCIEWDNNEPILSLRRTRLKGGGRKVLYTLEGDYELRKYSIPRNLALEIEWYKKATSVMEAAEIDALLVQHPHYSYMGRVTPSDSRYYTYPNLSYCLRRFQEDAMDSKPGSDSWIRLGDTRHLAMISLIISGGSPVICRELAGHEDINISSHYYSNISNFVECASYEFYRKQKAGYADMLERRFLTQGESAEINGGSCDSKVYISGSVADCVRHMGPNGELGYCRCCPHFIDSSGSSRHIVFSHPGERKKQVDEDAKYLMRVLEMVRRGNGSAEDLQSAMLKLQQSSAQYSLCLYENMEVK